MDWIEAKDKPKTNKYRISYSLRLNKKTDADVIKRLEEVKGAEGMQSYIKRLIREDMGK